jgi:hypothetical protein
VDRRRQYNLPNGSEIPFVNFESVTWTNAATESSTFATSLYDANTIIVDLIDSNTQYTDVTIESLFLLEITY